MSVHVDEDVEIWIRQDLASLNHVVMLDHVDGENGFCAKLWERAKRCEVFLHE